MSELPPQSAKNIQVIDSQAAIIGDHARVDEIHIHVPPSRLGALLGRKERIVTLTPDRQRRSREKLLANLKATWIDGYLHNAVHHAVFMELGLEYKREAVIRPWDLTLQPTNQPIPHDKPIGAVFREHGRSLLILGDPASGKTITMLQLAEELLAEAEEDDTCPIPIILNLSSWARERQPLPDWLVEEMVITYQVSRPLTRAWLEVDSLALLLDGLDEVDEGCRDDCIAAINDFKAEHQVDIVVCSRIADYDKLSNRLNLSTAIRIRPLTPEQINVYLDQFGAAVGALREALMHDRELQELGKSPLMLSLMPLTYGELRNEDMPAAASLEGKRVLFFTSYVRRVFQNRPLPRDSAYDQSQALRWLTNLAQGMAEHKQSTFHIERLQLTWLRGDPSNRRHRLLLGLFLGLIDGLIVGLIVGLVVGLIVTPFPGLIAGLGVEGDWGRKLLIGLLFGLLVGVFVGSVVGLGVWVSEGLSVALTGEAALPEEESYWSLPIPRRVQNEMWRGVLDGILVAAPLALLFGVAILLPDWRPLETMVAVMMMSLFLALLGAAVGGLTNGLGAHFQTVQTRRQAQANQGVRTYFRNAPPMILLAILAGGLFGGLVLGLPLELAGAQRWLITWASLGLIVGLVYGVSKYGGNAATQHYALRLLLARRDILPFPLSDRRLIAYLDAMADRILLRRVGGGWMFIHRYLLEYFASLHPVVVGNEL